MNVAQHRQVWNSYWSSWVFKLFLFVAIAGPVVLLSVDDRDAKLAMVVIWSIGAVILAGFVGYRLKQQFAQPQARLMPGFARPHLGVAIYMGVMFGLLMPWTAALGLGYPPLGIMALAATGWVYLVWAFTELSKFVSATAWLLIATLYFGVQWFQGPLESIIKGHEPAISIWLLVASGVAFAELTRRLTRLSEDDPAYKRRTVTAALGNLNRPSRRDIQAGGWEKLDRWQWKWFYRSAEVPTNLQRGSRSTALSVQLWSIGNFPMSMRAMAVQMVVVMWLMLHLMNPSAKHPNDTQSFMLWPFPFIVLIGLQMSLMQLSQRHMKLGLELLRPVSRREFASRVILATALDIVEFIVTAVLCGALITVISNRGIPDLAPLGRYAIPFVGAMCGVFGFGIWASSLRCPPLTMILLNGGMFGFIMPFVFSGLKRDPQPLLIVSAVSFVVGVVFLRLGYRRWCNMEVG